MSAIHSVEEDFPGTDRFEIVRRLGAGGMGVVYHARDRQRSTDVALKTLRRLSAAAIYHFKQEFRSLGDVSHPNLVTLHELVSEGGQWFFTMELVDGVDFLSYVRSATASTPAAETLDADASTLPPRSIRESRVLLSARLDVGRLRSALRQLVEGILALHRAGKLHRDIKPSNVMVTAEGRVVLLDFGLTRDLDDDGTPLPSSLEQHVLGTPEYMAPEQAAIKTPSPASDWYSVGCILFEALTGGLPFVGGPLEILLAKEKQDGPAPSQFVADVPDDLDRLCADLLRRRPDDRPVGEDVLRRLEHMSGPLRASQKIAVGIPSSARAPAAPTLLIGRESHLMVLQSSFMRSRQGRAVAVHLMGRTGLGKTALLRHFVEWAGDKHRAVTLVGRCYERESVPYKALDGVIDALSRHLRRLSKSQIDAILPRDVRALARLFPVLMRVDAVAATAKVALDGADPKEVRKRAFIALRELLGRLADRRPLVVAIDDLQWGDRDSMALIVDLLRPPSPPPLLFIASYRSDDVDKSPALRALFELEALAGGGAKATPDKVVDLRRSTSSLRRMKIETACEVRKLKLEPLGEEESRALVHSLVDGEGGPPRESGETIAERQIDTVVGQAAGSPFLVLEFVRYLRAIAARGGGSAEGRVTIEEAIAARLSSLPEDGRRILELVSVAGRPISQAVVKRAARLEDERGAVAILRAQQLVRSVQSDDDPSIETYHDRIRETVVARLDVKTLTAHHRALAEALEASKLDDPEGLHAHFRAAGEDLKASKYAALAAERADRTLAFERAAMLYRLAIDLADAKSPSTRALRVKLADALVHCGRSAEAGHEYLAAAADGERTEMLELHRRAAEQMLVSGHIDEGLSVLKLVLDELGDDLAKTPRRALFSLVVRRVQIRLRGLDYHERSPEQIPKEDLMRIDTYWSIGSGLAMVDTIRATDFQTRHLLHALRAGDSVRIARALGAESCFSATGGGVTQARTAMLVERTRALAEKIGQPYPTALATASAAWQAYHLGHFRDGRALLERTEKLFREKCAGVGWELATTQTFWLGSLFYLGDLLTMAESVPALFQEAERRGDHFFLTNLRLAHSSFVWLVDDEPEHGRRDVEEAIAAWSDRGFHLQHYYELLARTQFDLYAGDPKGALERLDRAWPALDRALILRAQRVRIEAFHLRARCLVAAAAHVHPSEKGALLRRAARDAARIEHEKMTWSDPLSALIRASIAHLQGDADGAIANLSLASEQLRKTEMALYAAVARRRYGEALGGDEGQALIDAANAWMSAQEIKSTARMTAVLTPGFKKV